MEKITITITCDKCRKELSFPAEFTTGARISDRNTVHNLMEKGWHIVDFKHYCPDCFKGIDG